MEQHSVYKDGQANIIKENIIDRSNNQVNKQTYVTTDHRHSYRNTTNLLPRRRPTESSAVLHVARTNLPTAEISSSGFEPGTAGDSGTDRRMVGSLDKKFDCIFLFGRLVRKTHKLTSALCRIQAPEADATCTECDLVRPVSGAETKQISKMSTHRLALMHVRSGSISTSHRWE